MKLRLVLSWCVVFLYTAFLYPGEGARPVTANSSPEAQALLKLFYSISGHYTLTGQHNFPNVRDRNSQFAAMYIGKTPAVWSTDMGFAEAGNTDSYLARPDIVEEAIRQHHLGSIVTICWHAVPPTADEPVTFRPRSGAAPESLATIQGQMLDKQFQDVLTPGTVLHKKWCAQVDSIAIYLKKLQQARVPVLWRPYHEMNGDWFWWGGRTGKYSTAALYRQIFERFVKHHKLNNLIWVWSVDRPNKPQMQFSYYFPGRKYLDIVALDVYGSDFSQSYYDDLVALAAGKPVVLGEVGNPPAPEVLKAQPRWAYYVTWAGMVRNTTKKQYTTLMSDSRFLNREDQAYLGVLAPFRAACGLTPLPMDEPLQSDFSGEWILDEEKSTFGNFGLANLPYKLNLIQQDNQLNIKRIFIVEYADDRVVEENLTLDGTEVLSEFRNLPRITTAGWSKDGNALVVESKATLNRGGQTSEMITQETWTLQEKAKILSIAQFSKSIFGERNITLVYEKKY